MKVVKHLSKVKFNGELKKNSFDHIFQFILNCKKIDIDDGIICRIFTLTLTSQTKDRCRSLSITSIHGWDKLTINFLHTFHDYDYEKVCDQLETLRRFEGEPFSDFHIRFKLICFQFKSNDFPSHIDLIGWFKHVSSLPCISNNHNESKNIIFLSSFTTIDSSLEATNDMIIPLSFNNSKTEKRTSLGSC